VCGSQAFALSCFVFFFFFFDFNVYENNIIHTDDRLRRHKLSFIEEHDQQEDA